MNQQNLNLAGEVALVTGASLGIGKAIACQLAQCGATVVGTATSTAGVDVVSAYLHELGPAQGRGLLLNVNDAAQ